MIAVDLGDDEFVVIITPVINGEPVGRWPISYTIPGSTEMTREELAPIVRDAVTQISELVKRKARELQELRGGSVELRLTGGQDLTWLGEVPDTPEGLT